MPHQLGQYIGLLEATPVLRERRRIPDRIVRRQADKPAEQQVVVELLHQLALGADAERRLQ